MMGLVMVLIEEDMGRTRCGAAPLWPLDAMVSDEEFLYSMNLDEINVVVIFERLFRVVVYVDVR